MSVLNAVMFGTIAALIVGGGDYAITLKKHAGAEYGILDHVAFRLAGASGAGAPAGSALAHAMPAPPVGWTVRAATAEDPVQMTGLAATDANLAAIAAMKNSIAAAVPGLQSEQRLYKNGDAAILLDISLLPASSMTGPAGILAKKMRAAIEAKANTGPTLQDSGLALHSVAGADFGRATLYFATWEDQIILSALSTATAADTAFVMNGVDFVALQATIEAGTGGDEVAEDAPAKAKPCVTKGAAKFCAAGD